MMPKLEASASQMSAGKLQMRAAMYRGEVVKDVGGSKPSTVARRSRFITKVHNKMSTDIPNDDSERNRDRSFPINIEATRALRQKCRSRRQNRTCFQKEQRSAPLDKVNSSSTTATNTSPPEAKPFKTMKSHSEAPSSAVSQTSPKNKPYAINGIDADSYSRSRSRILQMGKNRDIAKTAETVNNTILASASSSLHRPAVNGMHSALKRSSHTQSSAGKQQSGPIFEKGAKFASSSGSLHSGGKRLRIYKAQIEKARLVKLRTAQLKINTSNAPKASSPTLTPKSKPKPKPYDRKSGAISSVGPITSVEPPLHHLTGFSKGDETDSEYTCISDHSASTEILENLGSPRMSRISKPNSDERGEALLQNRRTAPSPESYNASLDTISSPVGTFPEEHCFHQSTDFLKEDDTDFEHTGISGRSTLTEILGRIDQKSSENDDIMSSIEQHRKKFPPSFSQDLYVFEDDDTECAYQEKKISHRRNHQVIAPFGEENGNSDHAMELTKALPPPPPPPPMPPTQKRGKKKCSPREDDGLTLAIEINQGGPVYPLPPRFHHQQEHGVKNRPMESFLQHNCPEVNDTRQLEPAPTLSDQDFDSNLEESKNEESGPVKSTINHEIDFSKQDTVGDGIQENPVVSMMYGNEQVVCGEPVLLMPLLGTEQNYPRHSFEIPAAESTGSVIVYETSSNSSEYIRMNESKSPKVIQEKREVENRNDPPSYVEEESKHPEEEEKRDPAPAAGETQHLKSQVDDHAPDPAASMATMFEAEDEELVELFQKSTLQPGEDCDPSPCMEEDPSSSSMEGKQTPKPNNTDQQPTVVESIQSPGQAEDFGATKDTWSHPSPFKPIAFNASATEFEDTTKLDQFIDMQTPEQAEGNKMGSFPSPFKPIPIAAISATDGKDTPNPDITDEQLQSLFDRIQSPGIENEHSTGTIDAQFQSFPFKVIDSGIEETRMEEKVEEGFTQYENFTFLKREDSDLFDESQSERGLSQYENDSRDDDQTSKPCEVSVSETGKVTIKATRQCKYAMGDKYAVPFEFTEKDVNIDVELSRHRRAMALEAHASLGVKRDLDNLDNQDGDHLKCLSEESGKCLSGESGKSSLFSNDDDDEDDDDSEVNSILHSDDETDDDGCDSSEDSSFSASRTYDTDEESIQDIVGSSSPIYFTTPFQNGVSGRGDIRSFFWSQPRHVGQTESSEVGAHGGGTFKESNNKSKVLGSSASSEVDSWAHESDAIQNLHPIARMRLRQSQSKQTDDGDDDNVSYHYY